MNERRMVLVGFLQAQNCSNYTASWRHPEAAGDFLSADYYRRIAEVLEAGKFHLAFFDDRLALPDIYGGAHADAVRNGVRVVKMDPIPVLSIMSAATARIGLGATCSTTYYPPFHVARTFSTLDHMSGGRAAWNVVTSLNDSEAANYGAEAAVEHDERYDRADEFMEVVLGHWDSWDDDAILLDRKGGVFADPAKVRRLDHRGRFLRSRGPFTVPRTPQGRPVVIQAGQSGRGRRFAARWAEVIFAIFPTLEFGQRAYAATRAAAVEAGRDPDGWRLTPAIYVTVAETQAAAEDKAAFVAGLARPIDTLALLSEALNYDFAAKPAGAPFTDAEMASIGGLQAIRDRVVALSGNPHPTVEDFVAYSRRGTVDEMPHFVGTPAAVADRMAEWFEGGACDGFVVAATHVPGSYEDVARLVVPELQRRGLFHRDYAGPTLRENLGLPPLRPR